VYLKRAARARLLQCDLCDRPFPQISPANPQIRHRCPVCGGALRWRITLHELPARRIPTVLNPDPFWDDLVRAYEDHP
jgi:hypothetical protein